MIDLRQPVPPVDEQERQDRLQLPSREPACPAPGHHSDARGRSNNDIAEKLVISPLTAKTHVRNLPENLGRRDRAGLTALAHEAGAIAPGQSTGS